MKWPSKRGKIQRQHKEYKLSIWQSLLNEYPNVIILFVSGICGALVRAALFPEEDWRKRLQQGLAGILCAVFLGGIAAHFLVPMVDTPFYAYAAGGFIMGVSGELAIKFIQDKLKARIK